MQRYSCPTCGETTQAALDRVVWCGNCSQPLTIKDLMPVSVTIDRDDREPELPLSA